MTRLISYPILITCLCWLATCGSWEILRGEFLGVAYDSLASNLLRGSAEVDPDAILFERYDSNGKVFMYFGPLPAILRIIPNYLAPSLYGSWSRVSTVLAIFLTAILFHRMVGSALLLNQTVTQQTKRVLALVAPFLLVLGTPLAFLVSTPNIYHEAIAWGICGTLLSLHGAIQLSMNSNAPTRSVYLFSLGFGISLLSRLISAVPAIILMPFILIHYLKLESRATKSWLDVTRRVLPPCGIILAASLFQLWYNYARFDSVFIFRDLSKYFFSKTHLGADFSLARVPDALIHYFGISRGLFIDHLPFVRLITPIYQRPELYVQLWREQVAPLTLTSAWLILTGLAGALLTLRRRLPPLMHVALVASLLEAILVISYFFITERYSAELLPFFLVCALLFLSFHKLHRVWLATIVLTSLASIFLSVSTAIRFNMLFNPTTPQVLYQRFSALFFPEVYASIEDRRGVFLTDLTSLPASPSALPSYKGKDAFHRPLKLLGHPAVNAIGMQAGSTISYDIPSGTTQFQAIALLSEAAAACNRPTLTFEGRDENDSLVFRIALDSNTPEPIPVTSAITGVRRLTISLLQSEANSNCDKANLYAPRFTP